jgi:hypothetical protein
LIRDDNALFTAEIGLDAVSMGQMEFDAATQCARADLCSPKVNGAVQSAASSAEQSGS